MGWIDDQGYTQYGEPRYRVVSGNTGNTLSMEVSLDVAIRECNGLRRDSIRALVIDDCFNEVVYENG